MEVGERNLIWKMFQNIEMFHRSQTSICTHCPHPWQLWSRIDFTKKGKEMMKGTVVKDDFGGYMEEHEMAWPPVV